MGYTKNLLTVACGLALLGGCALMRPAAAGMPVNPRVVEAQARKAVESLARQWEREHGSRPQGLAYEAVWISREEVMIRASWGPDSARRMGNFIFDARNPAMMKSVEGDKFF